MLQQYRCCYQNGRMVEILHSSCPLPSPAFAPNSLPLLASSLAILNTRLNCTSLWKSHTPHVSSTWKTTEDTATLQGNLLILKAPGTTFLMKFESLSSHINIPSLLSDLEQALWLLTSPLFYLNLIWSIASGESRKKIMFSQCSERVLFTLANKNSFASLPHFFL